MDERAVRFWGVVVGGGCIAAALGVATLTGDRGPAQSVTAPARIETPAPVGPDATQIADVGEAAPPPSPAASTASAPAESAGGESLTFVVRFAASHPLGRAQALEARGRHAQAVAAARAALRTRRELRDLCFDRFTVGGAEIVLRLCAAPPASEQVAARERWSTRLSGMSGVEYAEPNVIAQPEKRR